MKITRRENPLSLSLLLGSIPLKKKPRGPCAVLAAVGDVDGLDDHLEEPRVEDVGRLQLALEIRRTRKHLKTFASFQKLNFFKTKMKKIRKIIF